jgi:prepilin-type N-terminal cleavage/methylation domain-containing protein
MRKQRGFTLIELLVVIAIIGLLSTLAVVALNNARMKSRDAKRISDIKQVQTALELYYNDQNKYPIVASGGVLGATGFKTLSSTAGFSDTASGVTYMAQVPSNPEPLDGGTGYSYKTDSGGTVYSIVYYLGGATGGISLGTNTACSTGISGCTAQ